MKKKNKVKLNYNLKLQIQTIKTRYTKLYNYKISKVHVSNLKNFIVFNLNNVIKTY